MRVTPSVNIRDLIGLSTEAIIVPSINEDMLIASTVPEASPAGAYAGGTTYALGDEVYVASGTSARDVYESLQASNTGHAPSSSPLWWRYRGRTFAAWGSGTTYAVDDVVLDAANHLEYVSLAASNTNHAPATSPEWWFARPSNCWRMWDLRRNTRTVSPGPLTVTVLPGKRINTVAFSGLLADRVTITSTRDGVTIYSETINLSRRRTRGWWEYFYGEFSFKVKEARFNLPIYTDCVISLTFERAAGDVEVAHALTGRSIYFGPTIHDAQNDAENFSSLDDDPYGDTDLIRRRLKQVIKTQVRAAKASVPTILDTRDLVNAIPVFLSGIDDAASGYFEPLLSLGVITRLIVTMDRPNEALVDIESKEI